MKSRMNSLMDLIRWITLKGIIIIIARVRQMSLVILSTRGNHRIKYMMNSNTSNTMKRANRCVLVSWISRSIPNII